MTTNMRLQCEVAIVPVKNGVASLKAVYSQASAVIGTNINNKKNEQNNNENLEHVLLITTKQQKDQRFVVSSSLLFLLGEF